MVRLAFAPTLSAIAAPGHLPLSTPALPQASRVLRMQGGRKALWAAPVRISSLAGGGTPERSRQGLFPRRISRAVPAALAAVILIAVSIGRGARGTWGVCAVLSAAVGFVLARARLSATPSPEDILAAAPPKAYTDGGLQALKAGGTVNASRVCDAIKEEMASQIRNGTQVGMSVSVYLEGREIASVCGGVCQHMEGSKGAWHAVTPETLFMSYSVVKGVAATALLTCVDAGECRYEQPVADIWKRFAVNEKRKVTIADAVSHRAGMPGISRPVVQAHLRDDWEGAWAAGKRFIEEYEPDWNPGKAAKYHYVSFSWIIGGIIEAAAQGMGLREVVKERVAQRIGEGGNMFIGGLTKQDASRASRLLPPPCYPPLPARFAHLSPWQRLEKRIISILECCAFVAVGNSRWWRGLCLPSSNGFFTARAIAKMYGAVVNSGRLEDGTVLVSAESARAMLETVAKTPELRTEGKDVGARMGLGYSPWASPSLHGSEEGVVTVGHNGMGGCSGFGQAPSGLAVCVMKNSYEPSGWVGGSVSPGVERLVAAVRASCDGALVDSA